MSTDDPRNRTIITRRRRLCDVSRRSVILALAALCGPALAAQGDAVDQEILAAPPAARLCLEPGRVESAAIEPLQLVGALHGELSRALAKGPVEVADLAGADETTTPDCDFILEFELLHRAGGQGVMRRVLREAIGTGASYVPSPGGGVGDTILRDIAVRGGLSVADIALTTRARDRMTLSYRLETGGVARELSAASETARARRDGEDLLGPMLASASRRIATALDVEIAESREPGGRAP